MKICLLLILFVTESVISEINLYSKCHLQYHEKDDVCSLESPSFSEPGPRTLPECAILCSFSEVKKGSDSRHLANSCVGFNYNFENKRCDLFDFREKFKVWKSKWANISCVFYQRNLFDKAHVCSLSEFEDFSDIPGLEYEDDGIYFTNINGSVLPVYCQFAPENIVYLVFQKRVDGSIDFWRTWKEYEDGFGNLQNEFWLGNRFIHYITTQRLFKLRIDMERFDGRRAFAQFDKFSLGSAESNYTLHVSGYSGTAGDCLTGFNSVPFSTKDSDHDISSLNCAVRFKGAWWYTNCHSSNLNGFYCGDNITEYAIGIVWGSFTTFYSSLKTVDMKIAIN